MKSNVLSALVALGLVLVACGDDTTGVGGSGAGSTDGGGAVGGDPGVGGLPNIGGSNEGGGGGTAGDGNDTIATADPLEDLGDGVFGIQGELDPPDTDADFFSFTGTAGPVLILSDAKPNDDPFAEGFMDVVVTLFDSNGNQIAQNDDPFPRTTQDAQIYTVLPADGQYFLKVEEFCVFAPVGTCAEDYFANLRSLQFAINVIPVDPAENSTVDEAAEPNDTLVTASVMEYEPNPNAQNAVGYFLSVAYGAWADTADVDGISLTVPADTFVDPASRLNVSFTLPPPGTDGNGSGFNPGIVEVMNGAVVVSRFDMSAEGSDTDRAELSFPGTLGATYLLRLGRGGPSNATAPFYFAIHSVGSGNPLEGELPLANTNDTVATSEALTQATGVTSYFIEGDLGVTDVADNFLLTVLDATLSVTCSSLRSGSGLQGFKATVLDDNGVAILGGSQTESATADILIENLAVTSANVVVKLEKTGQDLTNTGNYYRCGLHFNPAP